MRSRLTHAVAAAQLTRSRILEAGYVEFYHHGFQGGSLNRIVEKAGITKGALFHHFKGKDDLGYKILDEVIAPNLRQRWFDPLNRSTDPVTDLLAIIKAAMENEKQNLNHGCPLNNLAQEMSPLDEGFRQRINTLYDEWRRAVSQAFAQGIEHGTVRSDAIPEQIGAFVVAALAGMIGTAKNSQSLEVFLSAAGEMKGYLEQLRPRS